VGEDGEYRFGLRGDEVRAPRLERHVVVTAAAARTHRSAWFQASAHPRAS
jgi:hypothetical protein